MASPLTPDAVLPYIPLSVACDALSHWHLKQSPAFASLPLVGTQRVSAGCHLELRNCSCGSTLAVEVRTIPACRHCNGEGAALNERGDVEDCGFCLGTGDSTIPAPTGVEQFVSAFFGVEVMS